MNSAPCFSSQLNPLRPLAVAIKREWDQGQQVPDACAEFALHPEFLEDKKYFLDLAYEEFCLRRKRGEIISASEFCARFPRHQSALFRLIDVYGYLGDHPELFSENALAPWPTTGDPVAGFTIRRELGRGAFARVYLATEATAGDRPVALKLTFEGGAEACILGRFPHPNIVHVNSAGEDEVLGLTRLCMPFLGAATLFTLHSRAFPEPHSVPPTRASFILDVIAETGEPDDPPPHLEGNSTIPPEVMRSGSYSEGVGELGRQLADALAVVHRGGVYHQDLKPSNVLLAPGGRPVLLDFNLSNDGKAAAARLGGTLPYMSPEHVRAALADGLDTPELDGRADLFSLGVILYELLTGRPPFGPLPAPNAKPEEGGPVMLEALRRGFVPIRQVNAATHPKLARIVERCLALRREDRPADAAEVARALQSYLAQSRPAPRRWWYLPAGCAALLAIGVITAEEAWPQKAPPVDRASVPVTAAGSVDLESADGLFKTARQHLLEKDDATAIVLFRKAEMIRENENQSPDGLTLACISFCLARSSQYHAAVEFAARARAVEFQSAAVYNNEGVAFHRTHQHEKAHQAFTEAIRLAPGVREPLLNRATLSLNALATPNRLSEARADARAVINLGDPTGEAAYKAALLALAVHDYDDALLQFQEAARGQLPKECLRAQVRIYPSLQTRPEFCQLLLDAPEIPLVPMPLTLLDPAAGLDR